MYERNAIVIDRYFAEMLGYEEKNNLKDNYKNYNKLITKLEEYQNVSKEEDTVMIEFEKIANEIKDTQKKQESLYKRCLKLQETRQNLFTDLDENMETLKRKFSKIEEEIAKNNEGIKENSAKFIEEIGNFNEKSNERVKCGRERRIIEDEYQDILKETTFNFQNINQEGLLSSRRFLKQEEIDELKEEIKNKILKNGSKEKVPFNEDVIENAINISTDLEKRKLEILLTVYERTNRILNEIKNDSIKIERHKKYLKDVNSKMQFLNVMNDYVILFLDNERMNVVGGKNEHKKLMDESCQNFKKDIEQIEKLYDLVLRETSGRSTKKAYKEQYNPEYLQDLLEDERQFEKTVSKLNVVGTIIYPSYWRVEGMQKVYEMFKDIISNTYEKDLSEYEPLEIKENRISKFDNDDVSDEDDEFDWGDILYDDSDTDEGSEDEIEDGEYDEDSEDGIEENDDLYEEEEEYDEEYEEDSEYDEEINEEYDEDYDEEDDEYEEDNEEEYDEEEDEDDEDKVIDEILGFYNEMENEDELNIDDQLNDEENMEETKKIDFNWNEEEKEQKDEKVKKTNKKGKNKKAVKRKR